MKNHQHFTSVPILQLTRNLSIQSQYISNKKARTQIVLLSHIVVFPIRLLHLILQQIIKHSFDFRHITYRFGCKYRLYSKVLIH